MKLEVGQIWVHHTGRFYKILNFAYDADHMTWLVIHIGENGAVYSRTFENFCGLRNRVPRFRLCSENQCTFPEPKKVFHIPVEEAFEHFEKEVFSHVPRD